MQTHEVVRARALIIGEKLRPFAPKERHWAFANAVALIVTGVSGGEKGPSMREYLACTTRYSHMDRYSLLQAAELVKAKCYDEPITAEHALVYAVIGSFDDAQSDVKAVKGILEKLDIVV